MTVSYTHLLPIIKKGDERDGAWAYSGGGYRGGGGVPPDGLRQAGLSAGRRHSFGKERPRVRYAPGHRRDPIGGLSLIHI